MESFDVGAQVLCVQLRDRTLMEPSHFCFFLTAVRFSTVFCIHCSELITLRLVMFSWQFRRWTWMITPTVPLAVMEVFVPRANTVRGFHDRVGMHSSASTTMSRSPSIIAAPFRPMA
jgi:hypothetical protein